MNIHTLFFIKVTVLKVVSDGIEVIPPGGLNPHCQRCILRAWVFM